MDCQWASQRSNQGINADLCRSASNAVGSSLVASSTNTDSGAQEQGKSEERLDDGHVVY